MRNRAILAGAALAALLSGCTTVGPNFERPAAPPDQGYAMAGDPALRGAELMPEARPAGAWWTALGDPQLDVVMREALAHNQTLAEADANLAKAEAQLASAQGGQRPRVDLTAQAERERLNLASFGFSGFPNPTLSLYQVGGAVSYDLDVFGGGRRRVESVQANAEMQARRADAAYLSLTGNVALQAIRIASLRSQIALLGAIIADDQKNIDIVRAAEAAGGEAPAATTSGRAQLAADQALLPPLQQQLAEARHALALLTGHSPAEWTAPDFDQAALTPPAQIPVSLPSELVRRRPDILAAEADVHRATADIGVATARLYPDIRLTANIMETALSPEKLFSWETTGYAVAAGLTAPIYNGGQLRADKRAAEAEARAALARYRQTVLAAFTQVSDALAAIANDDAALHAQAEAEAVAQSNLDDVRAAYRIGGGALLPVIDAQRRLNTARRNRLQAEAQRLNDIVRLFTATAADWRQPAPTNP